MPSSERKAYVRFNGARFGEDEPFHALARDLVGNVNHLADQYAQVRVNWVARAAAHYFEPEIGSGSIAADTFYRVWQSSPFDLHVRDTGESYALRLRLRGARSGGSGVVSWRVVVAAETHGRSYYLDTTSSNVAQASTSSSTHAWLEVLPVTVSLSIDHVFQAARDVVTNDEVGGTPVNTRWLRCTAEVWASTTSTASVPRLSGLQVAEYYAP